MSVFSILSSFVKIRYMLLGRWWSMSVLSIFWSFVYIGYALLGS